MASVLTEPYFTDEAAAFERLGALFWPNGPTCPHCGATDRINRLEGVKDKKGLVRLGLWKCYHCRQQFTVRKGTVFESSHLKLHQWFQAAYLVCSSKKGVSSHQLARTLGVTVKTGWFASHRLRKAMRNGKFGPISSEGKTLRSMRRSSETKRASPRASGVGHKMAVMRLVERGGPVRSTVLDSVTRSDVKKIVCANVRPESKLMTDTAPFYKRGNLGTAELATCRVRFPV